MGGEDAVGFSLSIEGAAPTRGPKHFSLVPGSKKAIRIGRAPGNDLQIELRGCSQYHCEIRLLEAEDEDSQPRLVVRDLSMNGTGLKHGEEKDSVQAQQKKDVPIYHGTQILVPFQLKANQTPEDRAWLKVTFDEPDGQEPPEEDEAANGDEKNEKRKKEDDDDDEEDEEEGDDDDEDDNEKSRMQFVDLLMKTRDISAGTTYEDAEEILSKKPQWKAVDEQTRKECFEIFVEHLGSAGSKKKKKDKKSKKRKKEEEEDEDEEEEEERPKKSKKEKKSKGEKKRRRSDSS
mmetsp:Transcript_51093/g.91755  ORF Transcript_51093/g.91755 Transcript_51093/m.91755 type:complete len:290 (+) Transcript_51093:51-920(+)